MVWSEDMKNESSSIAYVGCLGFFGETGTFYIVSTAKVIRMYPEKVVNIEFRVVDFRDNGYLVTHNGVTLSHIPIKFIKILQ